MLTTPGTQIVLKKIAFHHFQKNSGYLASSLAWPWVSCFSPWHQSTFQFYFSRPENFLSCSVWDLSSPWEAFLFCGDLAVTSSTFWPRKDFPSPPCILVPCWPLYTLLWWCKVRFLPRRRQCFKLVHYSGLSSPTFQAAKQDWNFLLAFARRCARKAVAVFCPFNSDNERALFLNPKNNQRPILAALDWYPDHRQTHCDAPVSRAYSIILIEDPNVVQSCHTNKKEGHQGWIYKWQFCELRNRAPASVALADKCSEYPKAELQNQKHHCKFYWCLICAIQLMLPRFRDWRLNMASLKRHHVCPTIAFENLKGP